MDALASNFIEQELYATNESDTTAGSDDSGRIGRVGKGGMKPVCDQQNPCKFRQEGETIAVYCEDDPSLSK